MMIFMSVESALFFLDLTTYKEKVMSVKVETRAQCTGPLSKARNPTQPRESIKEIGS